MGNGMMNFAPGMGMNMGMPGMNMGIAGMGMGGMGGD
jgi:hypothetical protein